MPSIVSNLVSQPARQATKVELPTPAKPAERSQRGEGFQQMLQGVQDQQSKQAKHASKEAPAEAAEKSAKASKPRRAARAEQSSRGEKPEAMASEAEIDSTDAATESEESASSHSTAEGDDASPATETEKRKDMARAGEGEHKDAERDSESATENGECMVQAAGDALQQQPRGDASDESEEFTDEVDQATAADPAQEESTLSITPPAAGAAVVIAPAQTMPENASTQVAAAAPQKQTVSAIGGSSAGALNSTKDPANPREAIDTEIADQAEVDAPATLTPAALELPDDLEKTEKNTSTLSSNKTEKPDTDPGANHEAVSTPNAPANPLKGDATQPAPMPREAHFAADNHDKIVTGVRTQLLPGGGTMRIRLDPPELGALQVMVEMRNGTLSATFQTSNDDATQLLSHSLNQLKHMLESQGMSVDKLQVQQAPKSEAGQGKGDEQQNPQQQSADEHAARQEQQRKEMLKRMWRRASGVADPIDFTA